ncbi:unnamed protein product [Aphanomyces euteiches]
MTLSEKEKRRNWSAEEDLVLLRQVAADRPFAAEDGVMKAWQNLADTLSKCDQFTQKHRRGDIESAKLSGVSEEEDKRRMLLDDIVPLLNDLKAEADSKLTKEKEEKLKIDEGASLIREKEMETMRKRKASCGRDGDDGERNGTTGRRASLAMAIEIDGAREIDVKEKELAFKWFKYESDVRQRELDRAESVVQREIQLAQRKAEREHQLTLAKIKSEKLSNMLKMMLESRR